MESSFLKSEALASQTLDCCMLSMFSVDVNPSRYADSSPIQYVYALYPLICDELSYTQLVTLIMAVISVFGGCAAHCLAEPSAEMRHNSGFRSQEAVDHDFRDSRYPDTVCISCDSRGMGVIGY